MVQTSHYDTKLCSHIALMVALVSSMAEPGESQSTGWSGIEGHYIHRKKELLLVTSCRDVQRK
jgi:hypothetical protein